MEMTAAQQWLERTFSGWADSLSDDLYDALATYKTDVAVSLNRALRLGETLTGAQRRLVDAIDESIARFRLPESVVVFRGLALFDPPVVGQVLEDLGYASCSLDRTVAEGFLGFIPAAHKALATITAPRGVQAAAPDLVRPMGELEILLARGTMLEVQRAERSKDRPGWELQCALR